MKIEADAKKNLGLKEDDEFDEIDENDGIDIGNATNKNTYVPVLLQNVECLSLTTTQTKAGEMILKITVSTVGENRDIGEIGKGLNSLIDTGCDVLLSLMSIEPEEDQDD